MNSTEELEYYNDVYSQSEEYRKEPAHSKFINVWMDILKMIRSEESVIEIGCGSGQLAKLLIENGKKYAFGFDYSLEAIRIAKELNPNNSDLFLVKDVYTFKEIDCDTVICTETLEHLDDDLFVFSLLKPGTRFIFSVPSFDSKAHKRLYKDIEYIKSRYHFLIIKEIKEYSVNSKEIKLSSEGDNKVFLIDSVCR